MAAAVDIAAFSAALHALPDSALSAEYAEIIDVMRDVLTERGMQSRARRPVGDVLLRRLWSDMLRHLGWAENAAREAAAPRCPPPGTRAVTDGAGQDARLPLGRPNP